jgi:hypothetical protein
MYTVVNQFVCPSDYSDPLPALGGQTNYMADMGSGIVWQASVYGNSALPSPSGVFHGDSATKFAAITDGLSNTGFFSERVMADGNNAIVSPISDIFFSPLAPTTPDQAYQECQAVDIWNLQNQFPLFMGAPWLCGQHIFTHVSGPNSRSCGFFLALRAVMPPSSRHPAASTCFWATARSGSLRTRSIYRSGVGWAQFPAARSSAPTAIERERG